MQPSSHKHRALHNTCGSGGAAIRLAREGVITFNINVDCQSAFASKPAPTKNIQGTQSLSLAILGHPPEAIRLQESPMNLVELTERLHAIRDRNDWRQFHSPKNLAMAASVEMSELVEIFQWLTEDQSRQLPADKLAHAGQEVGDIVLYLLLLCSELGLDMNEVVRNKLADSERRFS